MQGGGIKHRNPVPSAQLHWKDPEQLRGGPSLTLTPEVLLCVRSESYTGFKGSDCQVSWPS